MTKLDFSLVTTCRNEIKNFDIWKKNVLAQTRPPSEIIIVDAFSNDGTAEKVFEWSSLDQRVKFVQENGAVAHGRNVAIKNSRFDIILSTDMGVRLSPNWCEELVKPFETDPSVDVVAGNTCIDIETVKTRVARAELYFENGGFANFKQGFVISNRSSAYRKKVWKELDGLPEDLSFSADDSVYGRQIVEKGYKMAFAEKAMTFWARPRKLSQFLKEQYVYGKGDGEALIKTPRMFKLYSRRVLPVHMVPLMHASIQILKKTFYSGLYRALKKADLVAAFYICLLVPGRAYNYAKGYLTGFKNGASTCLQCRSRLKRDAEGYSVY